MSCKGKPIFIWFTLKESLSGGSSAVTVTDYCQGWKEHPAAREQVRVFDPDEKFPRAPAEARGVAVYNDRSKTYRVIECEQTANSLLGTVKTATAGVTVEIENLIPLDGLMPPSDSFEANNFFNMLFDLGDKVYIRHNVTDDRYECWKPAAVPSTIEQTFAYDFRMSGGKLQIATKTVHVHGPVVDNEWSDKVDLVTVESMTNLQLGTSQIQAKTRELTVLAAAEESDWVDKITLHSVELTKQTRLLSDNYQNNLGFFLMLSANPGDDWETWASGETECP